MVWGMGTGRWNSPKAAQGVCSPGDEPGAAQNQYCFGKTRWKRLDVWCAGCGVKAYPPLWACLLAAAIIIIITHQFVGYVAFFFAVCSRNRPLYSATNTRGAMWAFSFFLYFFEGKRTLVVIGSFAALTLLHACCIEVLVPTLLVSYEEPLRCYGIGGSCAHLKHSI